MTTARHGLLMAVDDAVDVEYTQFCLQDLAGGHNALALPVPSGTGWLMVGGAGGVLFHSAQTDHVAAVRLEVWAARPDEPTGPCEDTAHGRFTVDGTHLRLWSVTAAPGQHLVVLPRPGAYRVRALVWGREDIRAAGEASFAKGVERWLVQIWPDDAAGEPRA